MANYSVLKAAVQAVVKTNGNQEITGANMQSTLISIINSLGTGYQFMGVATPSTSPGTPDYNVAYIGGAGTYANFGTSVTVPVGSICVFKYNGSWTKEQIKMFDGIDDVPTANSNNLVKSGGVFDGLHLLNDEVFGKNDSTTIEIPVIGGVAISGNNEYRTDVYVKRGKYKLSFNGGGVLASTTIYFKDENGGDVYFTPQAGSRNYRINTNKFETFGTLDFEGDVRKVLLYGGTPSANGVLSFIFTDQETTEGLSENVNVLNERMENAEAEIDELNAEMASDSITKYRTIQVSTSSNLLNPATYTTGLLNTNTGEVITAEPLRLVTDFIQIDLDGLYVLGAGGYGPYSGGAYYDKDKNIIAVADTSTSGSEVPYINGAAYVRFNMLNNDLAYRYYYVVKNSMPHTYMEYDAPTPVLKLNNSTGLTIKETKNEKVTSLSGESNLSVGNRILLEENDILLSKTLCFYAKFSQMGRIRLGHGMSDEGSTTNAVEVDSTNVYFFRGAETSPWRTVPHNIVISTDLQVLIKAGLRGDVSVTVQSLGVENTVTAWNWYGNIGHIFAECITGAFTDAKLSWTTAGYIKHIQMYGDSYFGHVDPARWIIYLARDGYADNALISGHGGRNSIKALSDFYTNFTHSTPKYLVWCMGMNDADNSSSINLNWLSVVEVLRSFCFHYDIELILSTIPNVPERIMTFKNNWIKQSGLRYIDFAKAVGGEDTGSSWYSGMLSDGVHPTQTGALALYRRFLVDFPEIMQFSSYINSNE